MDQDGLVDEARRFGIDTDEFRADVRPIDPVDAASVLVDWKSRAEGIKALPEDQRKEATEALLRGMSDRAAGLRRLDIDPIAAGELIAGLAGKASSISGPKRTAIFLDSVASLEVPKPQGDLDIDTLLKAVIDRGGNPERFMGETYRIRLPTGKSPAAEVVRQAEAMVTAGVAQIVESICESSGADGATDQPDEIPEEETGFSIALSA